MLLTPEPSFQPIKFLFFKVLKVFKQNSQEPHTYIYDFFSFCLFETGVIFPCCSGTRSVDYTRAGIKVVRHHSPLYFHIFNIYVFVEEWAFTQASVNTDSSKKELGT